MKGAWGVGIEMEDERVLRYLMTLRLIDENEFEMSMEREGVP